MKDGNVERERKRDEVRHRKNRIECRIRDLDRGNKERQRVKK